MTTADEAALTAATPDMAAVVAAAGDLHLAPRGERWCHLSLCVLDAVFSINADYATTVSTVRRYAERAGLKPVLAPAEQLEREFADGAAGPGEQPLSDFVRTDGARDPEELAALLGNRQLTSTRSGIRKAEAAQRYAATLVEHGIETLGDVAALLAAPQRTADVERALAAVPGHGSGVRVSYLWMLTGDDTHVKADRMVIRWVSQAVGRRVDAAQAAALVVAAAEELGTTPWVLDHAVWNAARG